MNVATQQVPRQIGRPPGRMYDRHITVAMPTEDVDRLREMAAEDDRTFSSLVRLGVRAVLEGVVSF